MVQHEGLQGVGGLVQQLRLGHLQRSRSFQESLRRARGQKGFCGCSTVVLMVFTKLITVYGWRVAQCRGAAISTCTDRLPHSRGLTVATQLSHVCLRWPRVTSPRAHAGT